MKEAFKEIGGWLLTLLVAIAIAFIIEKYLLFVAVVPTSSMYDTIKPGDRVLVTRVHSQPNLNRQDVVVFYSDELDEVLIKRLIGLPGDKVQIKGGALYINDEEIEEPYVSYLGRDTFFSGKEIIVPEGHYLFLGDNRADSYDGRYWDEPFIAEDKIAGKAQFVFYPFRHASSLKKAY